MPEVGYVFQYRSYRRLLPVRVFVVVIFPAAPQKRDPAGARYAFLVEYFSYPLRTDTGRVHLKDPFYDRRGFLVYHKSPFFVRAFQIPIRRS